MPRRLILDNGPANLAAISIPNEPTSRQVARQRLEDLVIQQFPHSAIHLPVTGAIELVRFNDAKRPHEESWFKSGRDEILKWDLDTESRGNALANLWRRLETFYAEQHQALAFAARAQQLSFASGLISEDLQRELNWLLANDLEERLSSHYILDDLQIACLRKNATSDPLGSMVFLEALVKSGRIRGNHPVLRAVSAINDIGGERYFSKGPQNEFGLKNLSDMLDCDLATRLVLGIWDANGLQSADVVTMEEDTALLYRVLGVRAWATYWNKEGRRNTGAGSHLTLRQGRAFYLCKKASVRKIFDVSNLREGGYTRLPDC